MPGTVPETLQKSIQLQQPNESDIFIPLTDEETHLKRMNCPVQDYTAKSRDPILRKIYTTHTSCYRYDIYAYYKFYI